VLDNNVKRLGLLVTQRHGPLMFNMYLRIGIDCQVLKTWQVLFFYARDCYYGFR